MGWCVICPSGDPNNLLSAFGSVLATHPEVDPCRLVGVIDFDPALVDSLPKGIRFIQQRKPYVYAQAINDGVRATDGESVILMNDDVTVTSSNTFDILSDHVDKTESQILLHPAVDGNTMRHEFMSVAPNTPVQNDCEEFPFICPYIPRRILEAVGELDETFIGYGKEDYDYCVRARRLGFSLALVPHVRVHHHIEKSMYRRRKDLRTLLQYNHQLLKEKWGIDSP